MRSVRIVPVDVPAEFGGWLTLTDDLALLAVSQYLNGPAVTALMDELLTPDVFDVHLSHLQPVA